MIDGDAESPLGESSDLSDDQDYVLIVNTHRYFISHIAVDV
jgi:hypothetical protein